jgi:HAD superfamily hydrolase (TIGR01509 family)
MLDLYIFDMGGVVSRNTDIASDIAAYLGFDRGKIIDYAGDDFRQLTTGEISVREFVRRCSLKSGHAIEDEFLSTFFHPELDPEMERIIHGLKNGARVVAGTNTITPHYEIHRRSGHYDMFDAVYASHLIGLAKPDTAFYTYILKREGCRAEQAVFIDDLPANVEAAGVLGIHSLLFTDAQKLDKDLSALRESKP